MQIGILAQPKGNQPASRNKTSLLLALFFALSQMSIFVLPAQSQIPVGLGISLGWTLASGIGSAHANRRINVKNKAIDACNRGVQYIKDKEYERAAAEFSKALEIDPTLIDAHWNLAVAYKYLEEYDRCLAECKIVMEKMSSENECYFMAAYACQRLSRYTEADDYYKQYMNSKGVRINGEVAQRSEDIIEKDILAQAPGDYLADATVQASVCWPQNQMPLKVFIREDLDVSGYKSQFATAIKDAFGNGLMPQTAKSDLFSLIENPMRR